MQVDYTATARRRPWQELPAEVRTHLEQELGVAVERVDLAGSGFTAGFAAVLSGGEHQIFAKAAPASDVFTYPAYLREAEVLAALPRGLPIPRLLTSISLDLPEDTWQVLCFEAVSGYMPGNPWSTADLAAIHLSLCEVQDALLSVPAALTSGPMAAEFSADAHFNRLFAGFASTGNVPAFLPQLTTGQLWELQRLCDLSGVALAGDAVLHNDLRADNVLIRAGDARAVFCDWNFLSTGPAWADWVGLLPYVRHGGVDVDPWLTNSPLTSGVEPEHIDAWLAILSAYMVFHGSRADIPSSPDLRVHGRFTARIIIDFIAERRGWSL